MRAPAGGVLTENKPRWSYSSLHQIAEVCGLQFRFQRIDKLPPAFTPQSLLYGSSIHAAGSWLYRLRKDRQTVRSAEIQEIFAESLLKNVGEAESVQFDEGDSTDSLIAEGRQLISVLVDSQLENETVVDVDVPFEVPIRSDDGVVLEKPLVGELDLVVRKNDDSHLRVRDLKTARKRFTEEKLKNDLQATAYLYGLSVLYPDDASDRFEWEVLLKNKKPVVERYETTRSQADFDRIFMLAKTADRLIDSGAFLPNKGSFYCKSCPFKGPCEEWR